MTGAPNIVVLMSDQHRADMLGCAGHAVVRTPNIDRLASEGVRFDRVSCQGPLCMPARASFLTERYVRDHGVYTNWAAVDERAPTYLHALREAGYHTVALGKQHLTRGEDDSLAHVDERAVHLHAYGFAEVRESGDKFSLGSAHAYSDHLRSRGLWEAYRAHLVARSYQGEKETGRNATKSIPMWDSTPIPLPLDAYVDTWHGDLAVEWIESYERDDPFYLFLGFPGPHDPWDAPAEAVAWYAGVDVPLPATLRKPDLERTGVYGKLLDAQLRLSDHATLTPDAVVGMRRSYYAAITNIDLAVGRVVDALARTGRLDDTWVVYTSDHGEMAGEHGMFSKCVMYDPAVRVPLVVRPPGGTTARVVADLVEQVDVPATLRDVAGAPSVPGSAGRSLLGYLRGDDPEPRRLSISENWGFASFDTGRYKLVVDEDRVAPAQLFDRLEDPNEDVNLLADGAYADTVAELMETEVRPFLATPPARPHPPFFTP